jgi:pyruvate/oxaloacetate carboxyltransferase
MDSQINEVKASVQGILNVVTLMGEEHDMILENNKADAGGFGASPYPVKEELDMLKLRLEQCECNLKTAEGPSRSMTGSSYLEKEIQDLKGQLKKLASRVPLSGVLKLGGLSFQSREDVMVFVETKMPSNGYYYFHDAVTLLESLSGSFSEKKEV